MLKKTLLLNLLLGKTAAQWKKENLDKKGNMRDYANMAQLVCLLNLESLNAVYISQGKDRAERLQLLNDTAISQMQLLIADCRVANLIKENDGKLGERVGMNRQRIVLFDLDGTLTDPGLGITNSVIYALDKFGISVENRSELYKFIGPPLLNSFMDFYGFDEERGSQAVTYYRELYNVTGKYENEVYAGVPEMLQKLKEQGCHLLVATSKPEYLAKDILEHFSLSQYFCVIAGSDLEGERNTKGKVIDYALKQFAEQIDISIEQVKENAIMVGDRFHDIYGAKENGIQSIAVLYGYGNAEEFKQAGADYIVKTPADIVCVVNESN